MWWKKSITEDDFLDSMGWEDTPGEEEAFAINEKGEYNADTKMYYHEGASAEIGGNKRLHVHGMTNSHPTTSESYMWFVPGVVNRDGRIYPKQILAGHVPTIIKLIEDREYVSEVNFEFPEYQFDGTREEAIQWLQSLNAPELPPDHWVPQVGEKVVAFARTWFFNAGQEYTVQKVNVEEGECTVSDDYGDSTRIRFEDIEPVGFTESQPIKRSWWKKADPRFEENQKGNFDLKFDQGEENFMNPHFRVGDEVQVIDTGEGGHIEETLDVDLYAVMTDSGDIEKLRGEQLQPASDSDNRGLDEDLSHERFIGDDPEAQNFEDPTFTTGNYIDDDIDQLQEGDLVRCLLTEEGRGQDEFINQVGRVISVNGNMYEIEVEGVGITSFDRDSIELMPIDFNPHYGNNRLGWWKGADQLFTDEEVDTQVISPYLQRINMQYLQENWPMETLVENILEAYENSSEEEYTAGIEWYNKVHNIAREFSETYGYSFEVICAVFARLSPNLYWDINYVQAIAFIEAHAQGVKTWEEVRIWTPYSYEGKPCGYGTNNRLAWEILETGDLSLVRGEKIESFMHNFINGPDDPDTKATVDIWATRVAFKDPLVEPHINDRDGSYAYLEQAYNIAADRVGLTPKQIQAVTWVHYKNKYGRNHGSTAYVDRFNDWISVPMDQRQPPDPSQLAYRPGTESPDQMNLFGWWKESQAELEDWWQDQYDRTNGEVRSELYEAIMQAGGISTRDDLREEYRQIPNTYKRKDGLRGDEMAEHLAVHYPHFNITDENSLIEELGKMSNRFAWYKSAEVINRFVVLRNGASNLGGPSLSEEKLLEGLGTSIESAEYLVGTVEWDNGNAQGNLIITSDEWLTEQQSNSLLGFCRNGRGIINGSVIVTEAGKEFNGTLEEFIEYLGKNTTPAIVLPEEEEEEEYIAERFDRFVVLPDGRSAKSYSRLHSQLLEEHFGLTAQIWMDESDPPHLRGLIDDGVLHLYSFQNLTPEQARTTIGLIRQAQEFYNGHVDIEIGDIATGLDTPDTITWLDEIALGKKEAMIKIAVYYAAVVLPDGRLADGRDKYHQDLLKREFDIDASFIMSPNDPPHMRIVSEDGFIHLSSFYPIEPDQAASALMRLHEQIPNPQHTRVFANFGGEEDLILSFDELETMFNQIAGGTTAAKEHDNDDEFNWFEEEIHIPDNAFDKLLHMEGDIEPEVGDTVRRKVPNTGYVGENSNAGKEGEVLRKGEIGGKPNSYVRFENGGLLWVDDRDLVVTGSWSENMRIGYRKTSKSLGDTAEWLVEQVRQGVITYDQAKQEINNMLTAAEDMTDVFDIRAKLILLENADNIPPTPEEMAEIENSVAPYEKALQSEENAVEQGEWWDDNTLDHLHGQPADLSENEWNKLQQMNTASWWNK